jgi:DNA-binding NarL/FixJ family response regulator
MGVDEGNSVREIAYNLNLSVETIETHTFKLRGKLDIHNQAQMVQRAIVKKIIKVPNTVQGLTK